MDSQSYKDRIRSLETEYDPKAWDRMEDLLDHHKQSRPRKWLLNDRRFFLLCLLALGVLLGGKFVTNYQTEAPTDSSYHHSVTPIDLHTDLVISDSKIGENDLNEIGGDSIQEINVLSQTIINPLLAVNDETLNDETLNKKIIINSKVINYLGASPLPASRWRGGINSEKALSIDASIGKLNPLVGLKKDKLRNTSHIHDDSIDHLLTHTNRKQESGNQSIIYKAKPLEIQLESDISAAGGSPDYKLEKTLNPSDKSRNSAELSTKIAQTADNNKSIFKIKNLDNQQNSIAYSFLPIKQYSLDYHLTSTTPAIQTNKIKQHNWSIIAALGSAHINSDKGYYLSLGSQYRLNKIISLSAGLGCSNGSNSTINEPQTYSKQTDINLIVLLHLVSINRHRLAFEIGSGWTFFNQSSTDRPFLNKQTNGYHLQGGISYAYMLNDQIGLGIKYGLISYDDSVQYLALKFIKPL